MPEKYQGWTNSATFGAHLYLMQEKAFHDEVERVGAGGKAQVVNGWYTGTHFKFPNVSPALVGDLFKKLKIELDEWMEGGINWKEIACNIEKEKGWGQVTCACGCGAQFNHHEGYTERYGTEFYHTKECYGTLFEVCDMCETKNMTVRWNAEHIFCRDQKAPEHACDACLMKKYGLSLVTITSG